LTALLQGFATGSTKLPKTDKRKNAIKELAATRIWALLDDSGNGDGEGSLPYD